MCIFYQKKLEEKDFFSLNSFCEDMGTCLNGEKIDVTVTVTDSVYDKEKSKKTTLIIGNSELEIIDEQIDLVDEVSGLDLLFDFGRSKYPIESSWTNIDKNSAFIITESYYMDWNIDLAAVLLQILSISFAFVCLHALSSQDEMIEEQPVEESKKCLLGQNKI